ncbi:S-adenosyl-L-methionine-dependent methyltransferase [Entophlyctis helioformis]|nr:S-adenosyl-L-methionine-dependent methyltransferase [Entophlyctis helioformis]
MSTVNWEGRWEANDIEWDLGKPTSAVMDFLRDYPTPLGKTALVPGCGTGYDVLEFAKAGYKAVGLDLAPTATARAREHAATQGAPANASFETGDFFKLTGRQFDIVFDYTFACAIDPSLRNAWAAKYAEIVPPGGHALVLMFPLRKTVSGPPFGWTVTEYAALLEPNFELVYVKEAEGGTRTPFQLASLWRRRQPAGSA